MNAQQTYDFIVETLKKGREKYPHEYGGSLWGGNGYACVVGALGAGLGENIEDQTKEQEEVYNAVEEYLLPFDVHVSTLWRANDKAGIFTSEDNFNPSLNRDAAALDALKKALEL